VELPTKYPFYEMIEYFSNKLYGTQQLVVLEVKLLLVKKLGQKAVGGVNNISAAFCPKRFLVKMHFDQSTLGQDAFCQPTAFRQRHMYTFRAS
jgi:hypothetical protein